MTALSLRRLAVLLLMALPVAASATEIRFEQGSLIIPMQRAFQTDCGAVAAYGLIYRLLQKEIPVYWAVNPAKTSHHRCKTNPSDSRYNNPLFNDGCDVTVEKASGTPVSLMKNSDGSFFPTFSTFDTSGHANNTGENVFQVNATVTKVRYMGAPFIIDAANAPTVIGLISGDTGFAAFKGAEGAVGCLPGSAYHVRVHRAENAFVAPIARIMNEIPPPLALVEGQNYTSPTSGSVSVLIDYLENANLNFANAQGTFNAPGLIFDVLSVDDLGPSAGYPNGKLNAPHATKANRTRYSVMWAPHWEVARDKNATPLPKRNSFWSWDHIHQAESETKIQAALPNIAHFVDKGNSIFNECGSIGLYEDAYATTYGLSVPMPYAPFMLSLPAELPYPELPANNSTRFMSSNGMWIPRLGSLEDFASATQGQDCTDPGIPANQDCYNYTHHTDLLSQRGDYPFVAVGGLVEGFKPRGTHTFALPNIHTYTPGSYLPGTSRVISTRSTNPELNGWDLYATRFKDDNRDKGSIIYLAGHTLQNSAAGNRMVLNTLLNLAFKPGSQETSRSEPVADIVEGTPATVNVLSATFLNTPPPSLYQERISFQQDKAADWIFPYIEGRLRSVPADQIGTSLQGYSVNASWEASARMPTPGNRTLFTVLGTNQNGLKRLPFNLTQLTLGGCQNDATTGSVASVCDLEEAIGLSDASLTAPQLNHMTQHVLQRVRGFCVAHSGVETMTPSLAQCDNHQFGEVRSTLGGLDHASPAVVGPSAYIKVPRPTVAYVGGLDGQLHAIYLRGTQTGFTPPAAGTELWAFLPKGQLSRLLTNNARVDVSPAVADVFVDYEDTNNNGVLDADPALNERDTGRFRWRTVLVSGSGRLGGEIFALDVTDPLKPIILWDVTAASDNTDPAVVAQRTAFKWSDSDAVAPDYNDLALAPRTGPYNFTDMGDSLELNLVPVRRGNIPSFQLIVSTNGATAGAQQLQVFALDAGTGRKLWQWERRYSAGTSNSVPAGTSTLDVDGDGGMDRVYVGDMEGRLWELSIHTGANLNYIQDDSNGYDSYPLFVTENAAYHPISTAPAIMRLPYTFATGSPFAGLAAGAGGKRALVFGTAGNDWVLSRLSTVKGRVYVVAAMPEDKGIRHHLTYDKVNKPTAAVKGTMNAQGTVKRSGGALFHELAEKERAVGAPQIVGSKIVLTTAFGTTENNFLATNMEGTTHVLDLGTAGGARAVADSGKAAAGGLVLPDGSLITQSMTGIVKVPAASALGTDGVPKTGLAGKRTRARVGAWMDLGRSLAE